MRIAVFHNLPSGGAKRALYEWTRRLSAMHEIDVYTLSTADLAFADIRPLVKNHHIVDFTPHRLFKKTGLGRLNRLQRWRDLGQLVRIGRQIAEKINQSGYDVVFANSCQYTFIPAFLRFVEIPAVYYLHEPFGPTFKRRFQRPYLKKETKWREISKHLDPFVALYERRLEDIRIQSIRQTTILLANSQFTQQHMKREYGVGAPVCQYGVDIGIFHPQPDVQKEYSVISVGAMEPRKGFDFLIESLACISCADRPRLKLVANWVSNEEKRYVEGLAKRYDIDLQIFVNLDSERLAVEYNKAQLCVYAPIWEPLGLVPLESMACGTPVVGVREGGVRETILHGETGLLTERDPRCFADAIMSLLGDPDRRREFGCQGRAHVEKHWRWEHSVRDLETHLLHAVQRSPAEVA